MSTTGFDRPAEETNGIPRSDRDEQLQLELQAWAKREAATAPPLTEAAAQMIGGVLRTALVDERTSA